MILNKLPKQMQIQKFRTLKLGVILSIFDRSAKLSRFLCQCKCLQVLSALCIFRTLSMMNLSLALLGSAINVQTSLLSLMQDPCLLPEEICSRCVYTFSLTSPFSSHFSECFFFLKCFIVVLRESLTCKLYKMPSVG